MHRAPAWPRRPDRRLRAARAPAPTCPWHWRPIAGEAADRRRIAALLPQPRLCAPAQQRRARPFRVGGDERRIAAEIRRRLGWRRMNHSTSFCAAGSAILFRCRSPPRSLPCARDRWLPSPARDRRSAERWPPWEQAKPSTASPCVVRKRAWRADFFRARRCDGGEPPSPRATSWSLRAPSGRVAYGWPARSHPSRRERAQLA